MTEPTQPRPNLPTIDYLAQNRLAIYVLNTTKPVVPLFLTIASPGMKPESRIIPKTWVPFDLRSFASGEVLQYNQDLRNLLMKRRLKLLWPEEAEQMLNDPEAAEELQRIAIEPPFGGTVDSAADSGDEAFAEIKANAAAKRGQQGAQPSDEVRSLVENYRDGAVTARAIYGEVRTMSASFSAADLDHLIRNIDEPRVREFCAEQLRTAKSLPAGDQVFESEEEVFASMSPEEVEAENQRAAQALAEQQSGAAAAMRGAREKLARRLDR